MTTPLLEVEDLSIGYRSGNEVHLAVEKVSFRVDHGGAFGLVGESGCGKTTIGMALMGLLPSNAKVVSGRIGFQGRDLTAMDEADMQKIRWRQISMIFQAAMNALNPVHRIQDQIAEAIFLHEPELSSHAVAHRTRALFELVKIPLDRLRDYPHQFSGGMRQRVVIAMALACNPCLIIADEPTTALDVIVQSQILQAICNFQKEMNIGMVFISHDIAVVGDVCSTIGVMHAGRLVETGQREEVLDCPGHPYTQMLVGSMLRLSEQPADLSDTTCHCDDRSGGDDRGCPMYTTCTKRIPACRKERVEWVTLTETHRVRCHLAEKGR